jgi:glycosyltransferase involved in cell wall biosynthesis
VVTIRNGINLEKFETILNVTEIRKVLGVAPECPLVMQIGRMSAQKSPFDFVKGAAIVHHTRPDVQFVMIGDGPLLEDVRQRVRDLSLEGIVMVPGAIENAFRFIPAADILTLTSLWEGLPYSLLEAMAYSKPIVATSVNGCPEIIDSEQSGLLVPPGNPQKWAEGVVKLINNPENARLMGQKGRCRLEESFSLPRMIQKIENLYKQTLVCN